MSTNGTTPDPMVQLGIVDPFEVDEIGLAALEEASPEFAKRAKERILNHNEYVESLNQQMRDKEAEREERYQRNFKRAVAEDSARTMIDTLTVLTGFAPNAPEVREANRRIQDHFSDQKYREGLAAGLEKRKRGDRRS
jgi:hypothetical protein